MKPINTYVKKNNAWLNIEQNMSFKIFDYKGNKDPNAFRRALQNKINDVKDQIKD